MCIQTNHPSSTPASMDSPHDTDNNDTNDADDSAKVETERITLSAECVSIHRDHSENVSNYGYYRSMDQELTRTPRSWQPMSHR